MDKREVLAAYLNKKGFKDVESNDIIYHYYCTYNTIDYLIIREGNEEEDYLNTYVEEMIEQDKIELENAGFSYLIDYIRFYDMYETDSMLDHGFEEFTYKGILYFIREE